MDKEITLDLVERALWSMRENAAKYAKAKSERCHLQEYRKSLKAILMNEKQGEPQHVRESYAYASERYTDHLEVLKSAIEEEEAILWKLKAAQITAEVWRSKESSNRVQDSAHR